MKANLATEAIASVHRWLGLWNTPGLAARATIEYSSRLTRSLGRCYPERRLIRLAGFLETGLDEGESTLLEEVLCHELAHLAARELHGLHIRPHGPEWKALMRAAGFEPRIRLPLPASAPNPRPRRRRQRYLYLHRCPICQLSKTAKRAVRQWRCAACLGAGLDGTLDITRRPL